MKCIKCDGEAYVKRLQELDKRTKRKYLCFKNVQLLHLCYNVLKCAGKPKKDFIRMEIIRCSMR